MIRIGPRTGSAGSHDDEKLWIRDRTHRIQFMEKTFQAFDSFDACEQADRAESRAMTPAQRLELLERLRRTHYPNGKTPPRIQRVLEVVEPPQR